MLTKLKKEIQNSLVFGDRNTADPSLESDSPAKSQVNEFVTYTGQFNDVAMNFSMLMVQGSKFVAPFVKTAINTFPVIGKLIKSITIELNNDAGSFTFSVNKFLGNSTLKTLHLGHLTKQPVLIQGIPENSNNNMKVVTGAIVSPVKECQQIQDFTEMLQFNNYIFNSENNIATIRYENEFTQIRETVGFKYIQYILSHPKKDISINELFLAVNKINQNDYVKTKDDSDEQDDSDGQDDDKPMNKGALVEQGVFVEQGALVEQGINYQDMIDTYKKEWKRLKQRYETAEENNNENQMVKIDKDIKLLETEIKRLIQEMKKGKTYRSPEYEKMRVSLSKAISDFYKILKKEKLISLNRHLRESIEVQNGYCYRPENSTIVWKIN
jgi:hypothetical protein